MPDSVHKLKAMDERIVNELERSRQVLSPLLEARDSIVREVCSPKFESQGDVILEYATRQAPQSVTPSEVYLYVRERRGAVVTPKLITAWLSKLVRSGKLKRKKRGVYELA